MIHVRKVQPLNCRHKCINSCEYFFTFYRHCWLWCFNEVIVLKILFDLKLDEKYFPFFFWRFRTVTRCLSAAIIVCNRRRKIILVTFAKRCNWLNWLNKHSVWFGNRQHYCFTAVVNLTISSTLFLCWNCWSFQAYCPFVRPFFQRSYTVFLQSTTSSSYELWCHSTPCVPKNVPVCDCLSLPNINRFSEFFTGAFCGQLAIKW